MGIVHLPSLRRNFFALVLLLIVCQLSIYTRFIIGSAKITNKYTIMQRISKISNMTLINICIDYKTLEAAIITSPL